MNEIEALSAIYIDEMKIISLGRFKVCPKFEICFKSKIEGEDDSIMRILFKLPWYYPCEPLELQIIEVNNYIFIEISVVAEYKAK